MVIFDNGELFDCKPSPKLFIVMGCPGVGKGTLIKRLLEDFSSSPGKFNYIEMGSIIRKQAETNPEIKAKIDSGNLISDEEAYEIVKSNIHIDANGKLQETTILDGFPRNLANQCYILHNFHLTNPSIPIEVIEIVADRDTCMERALKRREIEGRADDKDDIIIHRFDIFFKVSEEMKGFFNSVMKFPIHQIENISIEKAYSEFRKLIIE